MPIISNITKTGITSVSAELDNIKFNSIIRSGYNSSIPYILANSPWKTINESESIKYSVNAVDINWNEAEIEDGVFITTTGELLSWIKNHLSNDSETKNYIDTKIEDLIDSAPEDLNTLKKIADKLSNNDDIISIKANSEDVYTKDEIDTELIQLREENAVLLERIQILENLVSTIVIEEPKNESYNIITNSNGLLTPEEIASSINPNAEKPNKIQSLNMTELSSPTDAYLVYPLSWEIIENDQIVSPIIKDWNGFEIGLSINENTPTILVNDVEYRVTDIKLGKGTYLIEFK